MKKLLLAAVIFCSTFSAKAQTWDTVINGIARSSATGLLPSCTEIIHLNGNTVVSSTLNGVYKSTNYGDSWSSRITSGFGGYNGVRKISSGRILALGLPVLTTDYSIVKSDDNGDTWTNSSTGLPAQTIVEDMVQTANGKIYIACRRPTSVYVSSDNGDTWTSVSTGIPTGGLTSLWSIEAVDNDTIVVGEYTGIYRTTNAGANWTKVKSTGVASAMKKHPNGTIYCGFASGTIQKSTDNGLSWSVTSLSSSSDMVYDIKFDKSNNIYVCVFTKSIEKFSSAEAPLGTIASTTMGMTYPRVTTLMIDETGSTPIYMAGTMNSATISGYIYRAGYTGTSIKESELQKSFSIYPNPSQNTINIAGIPSDKKSTISIYSIDGKVLYSQAFESNQIDIAHLPAGNFFMTITNANGQSTVQQFEKK